MYNNNCKIVKINLMLCYHFPTRTYTKGIKINEKKLTLDKKLL